MAAAKRGPVKKQKANPLLDALDFAAFSEGNSPEAKAKVADWIKSERKKRQQILHDDYGKAYWEHRKDRNDEPYERKTIKNPATKPQKKVKPERVKTLDDLKQIKELKEQVNDLKNKVKARDIRIKKLKATIEKLKDPEGKVAKEKEQKTVAEFYRDNPDFLEI
jgi:hypothetical protein